MIAVSDVTAVIVTRGDVPLPYLWRIRNALIFHRTLVWDNSQEADRGAYGRYEALASVETPCAYFQDDDCVVSADAQMALLLAYDEQHRAGVRFVSNMDPNHNGGRYPLLALPGWGSICDRDAPEDAFTRWRAAHPDDWGSDDFLRIGCDIVFPVLTPSVMVDLGHENLPYAHDEGRTWRRPGYLDRKDWYYRQAEALR